MMQELQDQYIDQLEKILEELYADDLLATYLESEEEEDYNAIKEKYEPTIDELYKEVAANHPLQLIALEELLLRSEFEGLYLPRVLAYSVIRGELNEQLKYVRPQEHFKNVLLTIVNSTNFDILRKRIGQSIQMGFAYSSDIWITNLINTQDNKRIRYYLQSHKMDEFRFLEGRQRAHDRYVRQFVKDNYQTADFPETIEELHVDFNRLKSFLIYRFSSDFDNSSIDNNLQEFVQNEAFKGTKEHMQIVYLYSAFFDLDDKTKTDLSNIINALRKSNPNFQQEWLELTNELHKAKVKLDGRAELRLSSMTDKSITTDVLTDYYNLADIVHTKGYMDETVQEAVKVFYYQHEGMSTENEAARRMIYRYFHQLLSNLNAGAYHELFEQVKYYNIYMGTFNNQLFNQGLKDLSMKFVSKLLKRYTDKRGRDYQDIKKFVSTNFVDMGFLKDKEVVELFKTRRKRTGKDD